MVGTCGFSPGPEADGTVEMAYFTFPEFEGRDYATAMARELPELALRPETVRGVIAHTLPERNASTRVLEKVGFHHSRGSTMIVEVQVTINGSRTAIWAAITDIENASKTISGIKRIEVLEKPKSGLVGLEWRETRILFGKPASADKRITEAVENEFYRTRAESDGFVFTSTLRISEGSNGMTLTSSHDSRPVGIVARLLSAPMMLLFKGVAKKALLQDLNDIKSAVEKR